MKISFSLFTKITQGSRIPAVQGHPAGTVRIPACLFDLLLSAGLPVLSVPEKARFRISAENGHERMVSSTESVISSPPAGKHRQEMKEKIGREKDFKDIGLTKSFHKMKDKLNSGDPLTNEVKQMVCFLTSSPVIPGTDSLNPANSFIEELHRHFHRDCQTLFVCSDPALFDKTDFFANEIKQIFENAGFLFGEFRILDQRNEHKASELIRNSGLIILAGGHVPTQNRFFRKIGLRSLLKDYTGILIGISAGSMNSAETVYAQPERDGEAIDPAYQRFLPGLGLTKTMLLPHYQENKDDILDGQRVYEDIAFSDSYGSVIYAIPDGSYLFIKNGKEELRGEAYRISEGKMSQISRINDVVML